MIAPVLSNDQLIEAVTSNPKYYNNIQNVQTPRIDPIFSNDDNELLAQIGYKPELKRRFSTVQVFGVAFSIMGLLPSIASILGTALLAGPAGAICVVTRSWMRQIHAHSPCAPLMGTPGQ